MKTLQWAALMVILWGSNAGAVGDDLAMHDPTSTRPLILEFGEGGNTQMLYDRRQRPQALHHNGLVYIVYNGGGNTVDPRRGKNAEDAYPYIVAYDTRTRALSEPIRLSEDGGPDQHFTPVIWMDADDHIHVLHGCHNAKPHAHLVTKRPGDIGASSSDWKEMRKIRSALSYPSAYNLSGGRQVIYYRNEGHASRWQYSLSADSGRTWVEAPQAVTDLNEGDDIRLEKKMPKGEARGIDESSSYHCVTPSRDGKALHVAFSWYEDNRRNVPEKFWNPRYRTNTNLGLKFNLYYLRVDLESHQVRNVDGKLLSPPLNLDDVNTHCMIWDTEWRGSGKPAYINTDKNGEPTFIHCLSSDDDPERFSFWYVRRQDDHWKKTEITTTNHSWSSCYSKIPDDGVVHCYLVRGGRPPPPGWMNQRGGGNAIEEWVSTDNGDSWRKTGDLTPTAPQYEGWRLNCIQPVRDRAGRDIDGLHIFYGWKDPELPLARAFIADLRP